MNRRHFFSVFRGMVWAGFGVLIFGMIDRQRVIESGDTEERIQGNLAEGVHFIGKIIAIVKGSSVVFLSSACTHLGCRIQLADQERLICPCHGSAFDYKGRVLKGPAIHPLQELQYRRDPANGDFLVNTKTRGT